MAKSNRKTELTDADLEKVSGGVVTGGASSKGKVKERKKKKLSLGGSNPGDTQQSEESRPD